MDWSDLLAERVLSERGEELLKEFLRAAIPEFHAPTDAAAWRKKSRELRRRALARVYLRGIPKKIVAARLRVVWDSKVLRPDDAYVIRKLRYEAYPDYWIPALLYEPCGLTGPAPVVLNPNGHHRGGKAVDYKQIRCANLARRGVIALNFEFIGMGELQADTLHNQAISALNMTGLSGTGLFYLAMRKGLDLLMAHRHADPTRVGVTGLSGGGWQTIVLSAMDERVTLSAPVAGFTAVRARVNVLEDIGDLEQVPPDLTTVLDFQDMVAMLAPRPALLICNEMDDCCFRTAHAKQVIYDAVVPTYRAFGAEGRFRFHNNFVPGTHNYGDDNRSQFYRFLHDHWQVPGPFHDIHRPEEVLNEETLNVGLPARQKTLAQIALDRAAGLARRLPLPRTAGQKRTLRRKLAAIIRLPLPDYPDESVDSSEPMGNCNLRVGPWSVPVSFRVLPGLPGEHPVELIIAEGGRAGSKRAHAEPPATRFVADILGAGENRPSQYLKMLVDTVGRRLLGEQVAQILACARLARKRCGDRRIRLIGEGRFASLACLVAAALTPARFESLVVFENLTTLLQVMHWAIPYEQCQSATCFGLLEVADIPQMVALLGQVRYEQPTRCVPTRTAE